METKKLVSDEHGTIEYKELPIENGDVVVVKAGISQAAIDTLSDMLGATGRPRSIIVAVNKMSDIRALDESQMNHHGWFRADRLKYVTKFLESKISEGHDTAIYNGIYYMITGRYFDVGSKKGDE